MAKALEQAGKLDRLVTRWCFQSAELPWVRQTGMPPSWSRRPMAPVAPARLQRLPRADLRQRLGRWRDRDRFRTLDESFRIVDRAAARLVRSESAALLGREDACRLCFNQGKEFGIPRIYQLPTAHWATVERWLRREMALFPQAFDVGEIDADFAAERVERKSAELSDATHVLCHSSFVAQSLKTAGIAGERITVLRPGIDAVFSPQTAHRRDRVVLYAGTISARKGVHRLIRVWKELRAYKTHRLRLIGEMRLPEAFVAEYRSVFEQVPRLGRSRLVAEYAGAQLFVFNALADGFGHVLAEAMGCGTPVLASRNSGAPDLIADGQEGWLYDFGDDNALAAALDRALSSPQQLQRMGKSARQRALGWTVEDFAGAFLAWITPILEQPSATRHEA